MLLLKHMACHILQMETIGRKYRLLGNTHGWRKIWIIVLVTATNIYLSTVDYFSILRKHFKSDEMVLKDVIWVEIWVWSLNRSLMITNYIPYGLIY